MLIFGMIHCGGVLVLAADFNLNNTQISKLYHKFLQFQRERDLLHELMTDYITDYRQFSGSATHRYEHLRKKYIQKAPHLDHLVWNENEDFLWSVNDISILLGRHCSSINRLFAKMERSEGWCSKLLALRETSKASSGLNIHVYSEEIFDLIIDFYEEEYLLRFSKPRYGSTDKAPDIKEVRRFWDYLKLNASYHQTEQFVSHELPDIPPMSWRDIFSLIWSKVFNIRIGTICSVIFAVCFEIARRLLGINIWLSLVPIMITVICAVLIHSRKSEPDKLSGLGAGALLFAFLWISGCLSLDKMNADTENIKQNIVLNPLFSVNDDVYFSISSATVKAKEFFYRISPDVEYKSTGFLNHIDAASNLPLPRKTILSTQKKGIICMDVKYIDYDDKESNAWSFSFDIDAERFKHEKQILVNIQEPWIIAYKNLDFDVFPPEEKCFVRVNTRLLNVKAAWKAIVYGINTEQPNVILPRSEAGYHEILSDKTDAVQFVASYVIFEDGTSTDVRRSIPAAQY